MSNKGYIYTIVSLLFGLLLLSVVTLQYQTYKTTSEIEPAKVRTDELHFFVESTKKDMTRAMAISGRRAAAYLVDFIVTNNSGIGVADAEAALAEMIMNGTAVNRTGDRVNITHMYNHTMLAWLRKINETGDELHFKVNITPISVGIYPYGNANFLAVFNLSFDIYDDRGPSKSEICRYKSNNTKIYAVVSFDGIEDPTYPSRTNNKVKRYMNFGVTKYSDNTYDIYPGNYVTNLGQGEYGSGLGGGRVLDLSTITTASALSSNITNFSTLFPNWTAVPAGYTVFVLNASPAILSSLTSEAEAILNSSGGVINYHNASFSGNGYPYVSGLLYMNFSEKDYVVIRNEYYHLVQYLTINGDIINKTYYAQGNNSWPSFFDRLEGNLTYSQKYIDHAVLANRLAKGIAEQMKVEEPEAIGIESFVNVTEFAHYALYTNNIIDPFADQTSADYAYFNNTEGNWVYGTPEWFRLDAWHINYYFLTPYEYEPTAVGVWHFDEYAPSTTAYDSSRHETNGAMAPTTFHSSGIHLGSINIRGGNVTVPSSEELNITDAITITVWVKPSTLGGSNIMPIVSKSSKAYTNNPDSYMLFFGKGTDLNFVLGDKSAWTSRNVSYNMSVNPRLGWNFVAGTWDGTTANLYINGTLVNSRAIAGPMASSTASMLFGAEYGSSSKFNGTIDDVKIYNRALSSQEIKDEYVKLNY